MDQNDGDLVSRRQVVGGLAAGLAGGLAAAATPALAQRTGGPADGRTDVVADGTAEPAPLVNPITQYPRPPFPEQQQPWPGLAGQMNPRPDHGETSYKGSGRLAGRRALVTGGDSGIGRAAAIAFAREGADVAINYLPVEEPDAREVVALIRQAGRKAVALPGDIRDEAFCNRLVSDAVQQLGGLDLLVQVAGRQQAHKELAEITTENFDWTFKTNVYALFWITKAALPHMPPGSAIITTTSEQGYDPEKTLVDYAMTKAAIANFTKSMAKQLVPKGIRINAVAPGPYWTPLQISGGHPPEEIPSFGSIAPYGRPGQPAEIAPLYVWLASSESSYASGQVVGESGARGIPG